MKAILIAFFIYATYKLDKFCDLDQISFCGIIILLFTYLISL